jgi:hypothetical protein
MGKSGGRRVDMDTGCCWPETRRQRCQSVRLGCERETGLIGALFGCAGRVAVSVAAAANSSPGMWMAGLLIRTALFAALGERGRCPGSHLAGYLLV